MATGRLSEIPDGLSIFIDANIFIYHFSGPTPLSPACSAFLRRIEDGVIRGLLAAMERSGVTALASNDPDFQTVGTITLYRPTPGE